MEKEEKKPLIILTGSDGSRQNCCLHRTCKSCRRRDYFSRFHAVYKEMDIGSAKITPEEMEGVPHHLVDVLEPGREFNVVRFQELAKRQ